MFVSVCPCLAPLQLLEIASKESAALVDVPVAVSPVPAYFLTSTDNRAAGDSIGFGGAVSGFAFSKPAWCVPGPEAAPAVAVKEKEKEKDKVCVCGCVGVRLTRACAECLFDFCSRFACVCASHLCPPALADGGVWCWWTHV